MLHRAASNAYSWWWASHIRTKQSKWLEQNLQDMEDKVSDMLRIIENEGDTFAQRAEMYYRHRPELINHVEDSYRAYRALAERFDYLSRDLQSANRTIATVFPEQVQLSIDHDVDEDDNKSKIYEESSGREKVVVASPNSKIPKVPKMPKKELRSITMASTKKKQLNRTYASSKAFVTPSSGLSRDEALEEIDKLQKDILTRQTEKEFLRNVYERCHTKCLGIEDDITEMQTRISNLQDEFDIAKPIEDDEARSLMAATALKSCHDSLVKLQAKREKSAEEAKMEIKRLQDFQQKLRSLRNEFLSDETDSQDWNNEEDPMAETVATVNEEELRKKIREELKADTKSLTVTQLAEKIDELVEKVVKLETEVSSQGALVKRLRSENDELQGEIKTLEDEKKTLIESSAKMRKRIKELEDELRRLKSLYAIINEKNNNLQTSFAEASCNLDHLSEILQNAEPEEETKNPGAEEVATAPPYAESDWLLQQQEENLASEAGGDKKDPAQTEERNDERKILDTEIESDSEIQMLETDAEDETDWRHMFRQGIEEREKLLLQEYSNVLQNYKDVRKKLNDVEKKNRVGFFELAMQIRELKTALAQRDEEIQSLRKHKAEDDSHGANLMAFKYSAGSPESMTQAPSFMESNLSTVTSPREQVEPVFSARREHHDDSSEKAPDVSESFWRHRDDSSEKVTDMGESFRRHPRRSEIKSGRFESPRPVSAVEEKLRTDIDELLEDNLEFWLRFSASFHQIHKFETSVHDLRGELERLKQKRLDESSSFQNFSSEARPIYKHLREIHTELTLWLENTTVLKDDLHSRYTSLCNIQDELSHLSISTHQAEDGDLSDYQAAKFQGEVLNMKQENTKIAKELQMGLDRVKGLKVEIEDTLSKLDREHGISASKHRSTSIRAKIPLRSFLFGVKLKKKQQRASMFSCASPALQKQYSILETMDRPPQ